MKNQSTLKEYYNWSLCLHRRNTPNNKLHVDIGNTSCVLQHNELLLQTAYKKEHQLEVTGQISVT